MDAYTHIKWSSAIREVLSQKLDHFEESEILAKKSGLTVEDIEKMSVEMGDAMAEHARKLAD